MTGTVAAVLLCAALAAHGAAQAEERVWPMPAIAYVDDLGIPGSLAFGMRGRLGEGSGTFGLVAVCTTEGPRQVEVAAFFGGFPRDRRPVQLAVRTADGTVLRLGPVVRGGREAGFHSPRITDPVGAARFADVAFRPGSLVSNGHRSFRNRAGEARNRAMRATFFVRIGRLAGGATSAPEDANNGNGMKTEGRR